MDERARAKDLTAAERTAMIELRRARSDWDYELSPDDDDSDVQDEPVVVVDESPIAFEVVDVPRHDATQSVTVRDATAHEDRQLKIAALARRARQLRDQLEHEAAVDADIDLRAGAQPAAAVAAGRVGGQGLDSVVTTIRKISALRDAGLLTEAEFDAKMAELLARV